MNYTVETGTEDRATQGCAPSAASTAGMPTGGCPSGRPNARTTTRRTLAYSKRKMVLTTGSTLYLVRDVLQGLGEPHALYRGKRQRDRPDPFIGPLDMPSQHIC